MSSNSGVISKLLSFVWIDLANCANKKISITFFTEVTACQ
jgi:hypothetical protein